MPEQFVRRVYSLYRDGGPAVPTDRPGGAAFYTPALLDAFEKDTAPPTGAGVTAEWDPLCDCHAFLNLRIRSITIADRQANRMKARVAFVNLRFPHIVTLTLSRTPVGWRIADVAVKDAGYKDVGDRTIDSIMALLQASTAHPVRSANPNVSPRP